MHFVQVKIWCLNSRVTQREWERIKFGVRINHCIVLNNEIKTMESLHTDEQWHTHTHTIYNMIIYVKPLTGLTKIDVEYHINFQWRAKVANCIHSEKRIINDCCIRWTSACNRFMQNNWIMCIESRWWFWCCALNVCFFSAMIFNSGEFRQKLSVQSHANDEQMN